ncbi:MAG: class I SAM-dependent methyltransferase [Syntrophomonadaceae bacterium]
MKNICAIRHLCRANFNEYLHKALESVPVVVNADVMDLGCGTGASTMEMLRCTEYRMTAVDPDQEALAILQAEIDKSDFGSRITIINEAAETLQIPEKHFYIIIAEGLFNIIGFTNGLSLASRYLKPRGYMIIHDELDDEVRKTQLFAEFGFTLITSFVLDETIWMDKYIICLEKQIAELGPQGPDYAEGDETWQQVMAEIRMYKENPERFRSIYYVVRKC